MNYIPGQFYHSPTCGFLRFKNQITIKLGDFSHSLDFFEDLQGELYTPEDIGEVPPELIGELDKLKVEHL